VSHVTWAKDEKGNFVSPDSSHKTANPSTTDVEVHFPVLCKFFDTHWTPNSALRPTSPGRALHVWRREPTRWRTADVGRINTFTTNKQPCQDSKAYMPVSRLLLICSLQSPRAVKSPHRSYTSPAPASYHLLSYAKRIYHPSLQQA